MRDARHQIDDGERCGRHDGGTVPVGTPPVGTLLTAVPAINTVTRNMRAPPTMKRAAMIAGPAGSPAPVGGWPNGISGMMAVLRPLPCVRCMEE